MLLLVVVIVIGCCYYSCFLQSRSTVEQRQSKLTHTRIVINNIKDTITALFHMVVRADASEHGRQPQVGPGIVAGVPVFHFALVVAHFAMRFKVLEELQAFAFLLADGKRMVASW